MNKFEEKLLASQDTWAKYNLGTRGTMIVFLLSFIVVVIASFNGVIIPSAVVDMVFYSNIVAYATVTLGINGIKIILDGIAKIKQGTPSGKEL